MKLMAVTKQLYFALLLFCLIAESMTAQAPSCTLLSAPANGELDVEVDVQLEWLAAANATEYRLTIGTSPGGNEILDDFSVGDVTTFSLPDDLPPFQTIYVTISTHNSNSSNTSCSETNFTTTSGGLPRCTEIINPTNGDELVSYNQNITWIRDFNATGYFMTIRIREIDGPIILNMVDVGNGTNYKPPDFEPRTRYFVTMIPYNDEGIAENCQPITFVTGDGPTLPECGQLENPVNASFEVPRDTAIEWLAVPNVDGYIVSVGTDAEGTNIIAPIDVGNTTQLSLDNDLPLGTRIYVQILSYKDNLQSDNCIPNWFVIEALSEEVIRREIPKFFSPNNDGFNDTWTIPMEEGINFLKISIYNRYGQLLKYLTPGQKWNGTFNGKPLPSDSYWYNLELTNKNNIKGYFALKR